MITDSMVQIDFHHEPGAAAGIDCFRNGEIQTTSGLLCAKATTEDGAGIDPLTVGNEVAHDPRQVEIDHGAEAWNALRLEGGAVHLHSVIAVQVIRK